MDDTTTIDVLVWGAEYACCGVPFAAGDELRFTLRAPLTAHPDNAGRPTYWDDRHPEDPSAAIDVGGRIERITATYERLVPVAGAHHLTSDPDDSVQCEVDAVPGPDAPAGHGGVSYRVLFRIPAGTVLPAADAAATPIEPIRPLPPGPLRLLTAVVEEVAARWGDAVDILRARSDASVTLAPRREGAVAVRWNVHDEALTVELERVSWRLAWDADAAAAVETLRDLVAAAAAGRFAETLEDDVFVSSATLADGRVLTTSEALSRFPATGPILFLAGSVHERLERIRSGVPYPPWRPAG